MLMQSCSDLSPGSHSPILAARSQNTRPNLTYLPDRSAYGARHTQNARRGTVSSIENPVGSAELLLAEIYKLDSADAPTRG